MSMPLLDPKNIVLPPLHIKLELIKDLVKAMDKNGGGVKHLKILFSKLSSDKLKEASIVLR